MQVILTPELARKLLVSGIQSIVRHEQLLWMADNLDSMNGTTLHVGEDGNLIDGYHRCVLVVITGRPIKVTLEVQPYSIEL